MARSLYITTLAPRSGKSVISLGMMELLSRRIRKVGFFRPIVRTHDESDNDIDLSEVKNAFKKFKGEIHSLNLPTAPEKPVILMDQENRPQTRLDRMAGSVPGMSVTVGRIRHGVDSKSLCFTVLGHNTIRGAAGGTIELAELLKAKNWI